MNDTNPDIERIQVAMFCKLSAAKRISTLCSLSQTVIQLSRRAIARANPGLGEKELACKFVELHYGNELANNLRIYLSKKE